jgi:hypothetical protein
VNILGWNKKYEKKNIFFLKKDKLKMTFLIAGLLLFE